MLCTKSYIEAIKTQKRIPLVWAFPESVFYRTSLRRRSWLIFHLDTNRWHFFSFLTYIGDQILRTKSYGYTAKVTKKHVCVVKCLWIISLVIHCAMPNSNFFWLAYHVFFRKTTSEHIANSPQKNFSSARRLLSAALALAAGLPCQDHVYWCNLNVLAN